jgi:hypothetical protein
MPIGTGGLSSPFLNAAVGYSRRDGVILSQTRRVRLYLRWRLTLLATTAAIWLAPVVAAGTPCGSPDHLMRLTGGTNASLSSPIS